MASFDFASLTLRYAQDERFYFGMASFDFASLTLRYAQDERF